jgi:hypothetical protein
MQSNFPQKILKKKERHLRSKQHFIKKSSNYNSPEGSIRLEIFGENQDRTKQWAVTDFMHACIIYFERYFKKKSYFFLIFILKPRKKNLLNHRSVQNRSVPSLSGGKK